MLADAVLAMTWVGLSAYALLGGADFGGGVWDLLAGGPRRGAPQRELIEHSIGPVWEANHTWLVFILVVMWTGFPTVFSAVASTLAIPLTLAAVGVIGRGAAFAFRKSVTDLPSRRLFGATFALASLLTPFFLGTVAGAVASGRVPPVIGEGNLLRSWLNPTSALAGTLAVGVCMYLAAVYLTRDALRSDRPDLAEAFRLRALIVGVVVGAIALAGIAVLRADAPRLYQGLTHRGLPLVALSAGAGAVSLVLMSRRRYTVVRVSAALAVVAVLWGWGVAQYPVMLEPSVTVARAAASAATLEALLVSLGVGALLIVPSLVWLFALFQRGRGSIRVSEGPR